MRIVRIINVKNWFDAVGAEYACKIIFKVFSPKNL